MAHLTLKKVTFNAFCINTCYEYTIVDFLTTYDYCIIHVLSLYLYSEKEF